MPRVKIDWSKVVPRKFYNSSEKTPKAKTVGELIAILQELPPGLRIESDFGRCVEVHVYNISQSSRHVRISEPE